MSKSFRSFVFIAAIAVFAVPSLRAERTGCNPHPQVATVTFSPTATLILSVINSLTV